jgi:hypothetical protein
MRFVGSAAKGCPERAYAKWVVLHFLWSRLAPLLRNKAATLAYKQIWERHEKGFRELQQAANACFRGVILFYRTDRGSGAVHLMCPGFSSKGTSIAGSAHSGSAA